MVFRFLLGLMGAIMAAGSAFAQEPCSFTFEIDAQSSAFDSLVEDASERGGFWRPIAEAPDDVQAIATFIGRLDVCLRTPDGQPRTLVGSNGTPFELKSPFINRCTAALLPGNRLLTNHHCFYDRRLQEAGFTVVDQARVNFGYTSKDFTGTVKTFSVANREIASSTDHDAMVLRIVAGDANLVLGGHIPMRMEPGALPRRALTMIHHPYGEPLQFSAGTCQIDARQADLPLEASQLRHRCESAPGSSGSLLFDARSLAVIGLHNAGGLGTNTGYNHGHKIAMIEAVLGLGFAAASAAPPPPEADPTPDTADRALVQAMLIADPQARIDALRDIIQRFPGTEAAKGAAAALATLAPASGKTADTRTATGPSTQTEQAPSPPPNPSAETKTVLGMTVTPITDAMKDSLGLQVWEQGLLVMGVEPDTPAHAAGIEKGHVILSIWADSTPSISDLLSAVLTVQSDGRDHILVRTRPGTAGQGSGAFVKIFMSVSTSADEPPASPFFEGPVPEVILGMRLTPLTDAMRPRLGVRAFLRGLVIVSVEPGSAAEKAGLRAGDVISNAMLTVPQSPADFYEVYLQQKDARGGGSFPISVHRGQRFRVIQLRF